jgi:polyadenylate-binding protein 2
MTEEYAEVAGEEDLDAQLDQQQDGATAATPEDLSSQQAELEAMKARLKAMEEEATKTSKALEGKGDGKDAAADTAAEAANREEVDSRSIYVGNVDYSCTPEELQLHFQGCGTVNRVTILTDKFGNAKGFAYVEFLEADAVNSATLLDGSELRGREIKVSPKRTNVPGLKAFRGGGRFGGRGRGRAGRGGRGGGYYGGYAPRGRGRGRGYYSPY